jgi:hypothetical protein
MTSVQRRRVVVGEVLSNRDLLALILGGRIGPSTFAIVSLVCKTWLSVCRSDERVLRGVAQYQGGLTKTLFTKLFCVSPLQADGLPRTSHRRFGGGFYYLYDEEAVSAVLQKDGMEGWRLRLGCRARRASSASKKESSAKGVRLAFLKEERRHKQESQKQC